MTAIAAPGTYNALSMHHPWALAVACGVKVVETRSWAPPRAAIGERLVICSTALRWGSIDEGVIDEWWWRRDTFGVTLRDDSPGGRVLVDAAPHGAALAVCVLGGAQRTEDFMLNAPSRVREAEHPWGDYRPGRWAWLLDDVRRIEPVPVRGRQRVWKWTTPDPLTEYELEGEEAWTT